MDKPSSQIELRNECEKLADIFAVLQRCFVLRLSKELARGKVSFPQYFLLGFLAQGPSRTGPQSLTMTEIAAKMAHTTAAATGMVDRLEKLRYVLRARSSEDRRKIVVQITPAGAELVMRIRADMVDNLMEMMKSLESDEQVMWLQIYSKIFNYCVNK